MDNSLKTLIWWILAKSPPLEEVILGLMTETASMRSLAKWALGSSDRAIMTATIRILTIRTQNTLEGKLTTRSSSTFLGV